MHGPADFDKPCAMHVSLLEIQIETYSPCTLTMKSLLLSIPITCWNCSESFSQGSCSISGKMSSFISTSTLSYTNTHWKHKMHIIHLSCDSCIPPTELSSSWHTWVRVLLIKWCWVTGEWELTAWKHLINCYLWFLWFVALGKWAKEETSNYKPRLSKWVSGDEDERQYTRVTHSFMIFVHFVRELSFVPANN